MTERGSKAELRIGISGWRYANWRGEFYPPGLKQREELSFVGQRMNSVEINGSFYALQRPALYQAWFEATPPGFVFSVKGGRYITHLKRLRDIETPLANFFASGVLCLEHKLGPLLWQFPEQLSFDERFEAFLELLPRDSDAAAKLARRHDERVAGRSVTSMQTPRRLRHAVEVRSRVRAWRSGREPNDAVRLSPTPAPNRRSRDVYVYFDNDFKIRAPFDAMALAELLKD